MLALAHSIYLTLYRVFVIVAHITYTVIRLKKTCNIIRFLFLLFREVNYNCILSLMTFQLWILFWNIYKIPSNYWRQHFISFFPCNVVNIIEFFRYIILMSIGDTRVIYISTVSLRTPKDFSMYFVELIS